MERNPSSNLMAKTRFTTGSSIMKWACRLTSPPPLNETNRRKLQDMKNNSNRKANKPAETQTLVPLRVQIETRAYEIWSASGGGPGRDLDHWLQAEAEILKATEERSGPDSRP